LRFLREINELSSNEMYTGFYKKPPSGVNSFIVTPDDIKHGDTDKPVYLILTLFFQLLLGASTT